MSINQTLLTTALDWAYKKALSGSGPFSSAAALADSHLQKAVSAEAAAENLVKRQVAVCATSGFVTGLGGLLTLPVAIPANVSSVLLVQLRMILSVAILGGFDPQAEAVKSLALACLTGNSATGILEEAGLQTGKGVHRRVLDSIGERVTQKVQSLVKVRLMTKTAKAGMVKLGRVIPLVGGVVGGTMDAASAHLVGKAAKEVFLHRYSSARQF